MFKFSRLVAFATFLFLPAPIVIVIVSSFASSGYISFPPSSLSLKWYAEFLGSADWLYVLGISMVIAALAAIFSTVLGFLVALVVTRRRFVGSGMLETALMLPLILPHAALGVLMLGVVGLFKWNGTFAGLLLAHTLITLPYAYRPVVASLRKLDLSTEEAAMSLGATPWTIFRRVTMPLIRPGLVTALLFCFIVSFDEVTVTLFLVGPDISTLPVKIFSTIQDSASPVIAAISTLLIAFTLALVLLLERLIGLELFVEAEQGR